MEIIPFERKLNDTGKVAPGGAVESYWIEEILKNVFSEKRKAIEEKNTSFKFYDAEYLVEYFGLKGIEFGNWLTQEDRYIYMAGAAYAMKDFCTITGTPPMQFGKGLLTLSFGARGQGGSAIAHFEPRSLAINLTRHKDLSKFNKELYNFGQPPISSDKYNQFKYESKNGVGSLGHEYGHFIDLLAGRFIDKNGPHNEATEYLTNFKFWKKRDNKRIYLEKDIPTDETALLAYNAMKAICYTKIEQTDNDSLKSDNEQVKELIEQIKEFESNPGQKQLSGKNKLYIAENLGVSEYEMNFKNKVKKYSEIIPAYAKKDIAAIATGTNESGRNLDCILYDARNKVKIATDGTIMLHAPQDIKTTLLLNPRTGKEIKDKFVDWKGVIPDLKKHKSFELTEDDIQSIYSMHKISKSFQGYQAAQKVPIKIESENYDVYIKAEYLSKAIYLLKEHGAKTIEVLHIRNDKPVVVRSVEDKKLFCLIMPFMLENSSEDTRLIYSLSKELKSNNMPNNAYFETDFYRVLKDNIEEQEKLGPYWTRTEEIWARSFEVYLFCKCQDKGIEESYLKKPKYNSWLYPSPNKFRETGAIELIDKFIHSINQNNDKIKKAL